MTWFLEWIGCRKLILSLIANLIHLKLQSKVFNVSFWFYFVDLVLVYRYAYVFVRLCLDVHVVHVVLLRIRYDSCYAVSSTHWAAPQHTIGPPVL